MTGLSSILCLMMNAGQLLFKDTSWEAKRYVHDVIEVEKTVSP